MRHNSAVPEPIETAEHRIIRDSPLPAIFRPIEAHRNEIPSHFGAVRLLARSAPGGALPDRPGFGYRVRRT
jgi:hypothetical protein